MNVAKNWVLTIMLTALAFAHFSSELLLKEQMIISVKKALNSAGHINAKLIDFNEICQKNPAKSAVFYWLFLGEVFPKNFPWNRPIFLRICPENPSKFDFFLLKSREIGRFFCEFWLFSRENPAKSADFWANFDFFPAKSANFSAKFCVFFREIWEALLLLSKLCIKLWNAVHIMSSIGCITNSDTISVAICF